MFNEYDNKFDPISYVRKTEFYQSGSARHSKHAKMDDTTYVFRGRIVHCVEPYKIAVIENGYVVVEGGKILDIGSNDIAQPNYGNCDSSPNVRHVQLSKSQILIPGLIDTHIHAPQYPNIGLGYDLPLLQWLEKYTFPLESKYLDLQFSKEVYKAVVKKTISYGTTTACYFGPLFRDSTKVLVDVALHYGQRALIGKCNMIKNAPDNYIESREDSLTHTIDLIDYISSKKNDLVKPIILPRFALNVDMDLMVELGKIAKEYDAHIQTHISENLEEVEIVEKEFNMKYAAVYDKPNLLTNKTILAHAIYLTDEELDLISSRGTSVAHCPISNTRLQSGLCDVKNMIKHKVTVGLGSDVSGGSSVSIIETMRSALDVSMHLSFQNASYVPLKFEEAFYLATLGGAKALSLDNTIGNFEQGKDFDALIIDMAAENGPADLLSNDYTTLELLSKFIYSADDRNIKSVYVRGRKLK